MTEETDTVTEDHDRDDTCPCGPTARLTQTDDGDIWNITHHRLTPNPNALEETP